MLCNITAFIFPYLVLAFGVLLVFLSIPRYKQKIVEPLQKQNFLPVIKLKKNQRELIVGTGPRTETLVIGIILIFTGFMLIIYAR